MLAKKELKWEHQTSFLCLRCFSVDLKNPRRSPHKRFVIAKHSSPQSRKSQDEERGEPQRIPSFSLAKHIQGIHAMGFQQELYEIDLERGDGTVIPPLKSPSRFYADSAVSWALLLLLTANMVDPLGQTGRILALLALLASTFAAVALARRRPIVHSSRKILLLLFVCWVIYAARVYCLRARRSGAPLGPRHVPATKMQTDPMFTNDVTATHHVLSHPPPDQVAAENAIKFVVDEAARQPNAGSGATEEQEAKLDETRILPITDTESARTEGHEQDGLRNKEMPDAQIGDAWFVPDSALTPSFA